MATRLTQQFRLFASEDPLTIDIDNDSDAIGVDAANHLPSAVTRETNVSLYYGTTKQTITALSAKVYTDAALTTELATATVVCVLATGNVKVTLPSGDYTDTLYVNITATCSFGSRSIVFTVIPQVAGEKGADPVIYQLAPTVTSFQLSRDAAGDIVNTAFAVQFNVKRTVGNNSSIISSLEGYTIYVGFNGIPDYDNPIAVGTETTLYGTALEEYNNLYIELRKNEEEDTGTLLDMETLPITKDGLIGHDTLRLDLDNEVDSMLYSGSGTLLSGSVSTNAMLYLAASQVSTDVTYDKEDTACTSTIVTNDDGTATVTVSAIEADDASVLIKATYNGNTYAARFTIHRLVGADKYELVITPSAVGVNDSTEEMTADAISVNVYRTQQNGTRSLLQSLPDGYKIVCYPVKDGSSTPSELTYADGEASVTIDKTVNHYVFYIKNPSDDILDSETIPVNHVENGLPGGKGDKGDDAVNVNISTLNVVAHKSSSAQLYYVGINVKVGDTQLEYGDETNTGFGCSVLSSGAGYTITDGLTWRFDTPDSTHFRYKLLLAANAVVNIDIPFTVTVKGKAYEYVIHFSTVEDGEPGYDGDDGNGIDSITLYRMFTMSFESPAENDSGWIASTSASCPKEQGLSKEQRYLWQKKVTTYTKTSETTTEISLVAQFSDGVHENILEQTAFQGVGYMDQWDVANGEIKEALVGSHNAYGMTPSYGECYKELLRQVVYLKNTLHRLKPSTWYTLSFYGAMANYEDLLTTETYNGDGNQSYANMPQAKREIWLAAGQSMRLTFTGRVYDASKTFLRIYVYGLASNGTDWELGRNVEILSATNTTVTLDFTNTSAYGRKFYITPYVYLRDADGNKTDKYNSSANNASCAYIAYRAYVSLIRVDRGCKLNTYLYRSDNGQSVQHSSSSPWYVDGVKVTSSKTLSDGDSAYPTHGGTYIPFSNDGGVIWQMSPGTKRHTMTFKTPSSLSETATYRVLFRMAEQSHYGWISMPKLEENTMATEWIEHSNDRMADDFQHVYVGEWKASELNDDGTEKTATNYLYALGVRHCVRAKASASGDMTYFRLKNRTIPTGYSSRTQPYADTSHWEKADYLRFVAADLLLANEVITDKLTVTKLQSAGEDSHVEIGDGIVDFFGTFAFPNIRLGIDDNGCSVLQFYDQNGQKMYDLGPSGITKINNSSASFTEYLYKKVADATSSKIPDTTGMYAKISNVKDSDCTKYYMFACKRTTTGETTIYWYGDSSSETPPTQNGRLYQSKSLGTSGSSEGLPTGSYIPDGWYVKPNNGVFPMVPLPAQIVQGQGQDKIYNCYLYKFESGKQTASYAFQFTK